MTLDIKISWRHNDLDKWLINKYDFYVMDKFDKFFQKPSLEIQWHISSLKLNFPLL